MKDIKYRPLAFLPGDCEGARAYLDHMAKQGWELTGRAGLVLGLFRPTRRTELRYDAVPADPRRSPETLMAQVESRREAGWEAVDTIWGMDIYKSLPCREPPLLRSKAEKSLRRSIYGAILTRSLLFLLTASLSLLTLFHFSRHFPSRLLSFWYLSDRQTAPVLLLPLLAVLALVWIIWLIYCMARPGEEEKPASRPALFFRQGLLLLALGASALLLVSLWLSQIPRLWLRLVLLACFLLLPLVSLLLSKEDRKRYLTLLGEGVTALFLISVLLGRMVQPVSYSTLLDGNRWRTSPDGISVITAETLSESGLIPPLSGEEEVSAFYHAEEALLVTTENYDEFRSEGPSLTLTVYHVHVPMIADLLWSETIPAVADGEARFAQSQTGSRRAIWLREDNTICQLSCTSEWLDEAAAEQLPSLVFDYIS